MYSIPILLSIHTRPNNLKLQLKILEKINPKKIYTLIDPPLQNNIQKVIYFKRSLDILKKSNLNFIPLINNTVNRGHFHTFKEACLKIISKEDFFLTLENDSIPSCSYFYFVDNILKKYYNDNSFMFISGSSYFNPNKKYSNYYFESRLTYPVVAPASITKHCKDFFYNMDNNLKKIKETKNSLPEFLKDRANYLINNYENNAFNGVDLDTFLIFYSLLNNKKAIFPYNNLVENCGFDSQSRNINFNKTKNNNILCYKKHNYLPSKLLKKDLSNKLYNILQTYLLYK